MGEMDIGKRCLPESNHLREKGPGGVLPSFCGSASVKIISMIKQDIRHFCFVKIRIWKFRLFQGSLFQNRIAHIHTDALARDKTAPFKISTCKFTGRKIAGLKNHIDEARVFKTAVMEGAIFKNTVPDFHSAEIGPVDSFGAALYRRNRSLLKKKILHIYGKILNLHTFL